MCFFKRKNINPTGEKLNLIDDNCIDDQAEAWLVNGGAMSELIRTMNRHGSLPGAIGAWPPSLKNAINPCPASQLQSTMSVPEIRSIKR